MDKSTCILDLLVWIKIQKETLKVWQMTLQNKMLLTEFGFEHRQISANTDQVYTFF